MQFSDVINTSVYLKKPLLKMAVFLTAAFVSWGFYCSEMQSQPCSCLILQYCSIRQYCKEVLLTFIVIFVITVNITKYQVKFSCPYLPPVMRHVAQKFAVLCKGGHSNIGGLLYILLISDSYLRLLCRLL